MGSAEKEARWRVREMYFYSTVALALSSLVTFIFLGTLSYKICNGQDISQTFLNGIIPVVLNFVFYRFWKVANVFGGRQLSGQKNIEYALSDAFDKSYAPQRVYVISWAIALVMSVAGVIISGGLDFENEDLTALRWVQTMVSVVPLYIFWVDSWRGARNIKIRL